MSEIIISIRAPQVAVQDPRNDRFPKSKHSKSNAVDNNGNFTPYRKYGYISITGHHVPKDATVGFVFGPGEAECDVWLPSEPLCNNRRYFAINFNEDTGAATIENLSGMDIYVRVELQTQVEIESSWETITMTLHHMNIQLKRYLNNASINSPQITFFHGELLALDPGLETMGPDSTTASSAQSGSSKNESFYRLPAATGLEAAEHHPDELDNQSQYSIEMIDFMTWRRKAIAHAPCKGTVNFSQILRNIYNHPKPFVSVPLKYMLPKKHLQKVGRHGIIGIYIRYADAANACERLYCDDTRDLVPWLREEASKFDEFKKRSSVGTERAGTADQPAPQ